MVTNIFTRGPDFLELPIELMFSLFETVVSACFGNFFIVQAHENGIRLLPLMMLSRKMRNLPRKRIDFEICQPKRVFLQMRTIVGSGGGS